jgi:ABC-2 type transport system ATP-binding protein
VIADDIVVIGNGRIVAQGSKTELLHQAGTFVRAATGHAQLMQALAATGAEVSAAGDGTLRTSADPAVVGQVALQAGVPLTELRPADGAGLEEMFLELTASTQREGVAA